MVMGASPIKRAMLYPLKVYADAIYKRADKIVAVSDTYLQRGLQANKKAKGLAVYLGNNGGVFEKYSSNGAVQRDDNELRLAYIGTLGYSYDIPCVIDAIAIVNKRHSISQPIKLVVMGNGPLKARFEEYATQKGIDALFTGTLPYSELVSRMCMCDIALNPIVKGSAGSIINKVGDYALAGLPVINTQECDEYRKAVSDRQCGINCSVGNADEVADAIELLALNPEMRKQMGAANRLFGKECFDRRHTYQAIVDMIGC
jgi:glycosyltransferase involved in cell wall biosynthesis